MVAVEKWVSSGFQKWFNENQLSRLVEEKYSECYFDCYNTYVKPLEKQNLKLTLQRDLMLEHFDHDGHPDKPFGPTCSEPEDCIKCQVYALEKEYGND